MTGIYNTAPVITDNGAVRQCRLSAVSQEENCSVNMNILHIPIKK